MQRLIDANLNRLREGLRIIEDIARFTLNLPEFEEFKNIRHAVKEADIAFYIPNLIARDAETDLGRKPFLAEEQRSSLKSILAANFKRTQEALRSLEEGFKLNNLKLARSFKDLRYQSYTLEKKILLALKKTLDLTLYLVTDSRHNSAPLEYVVEEAILGGATLVQLREKHLPDLKMIELGQKVKPVCAKYQVPLLIDDRPDLCLVLDADGVHLGQQDIPVYAARNILGHAKIIGKSTHSLAQAQAAVLEDIDYFAFGPLFKTPTKDYSPVGLKEIKTIQDLALQHHVPVVFIGGITQENFTLIRENNIQTVAVVREIMAASNPRQAARVLKNILKS